MTRWWCALAARWWGEEKEGTLGVCGTIGERDEVRGKGCFSRLTTKVGRFQDESKLAELGVGRNRGERGKKKT